MVQDSPENTVHADKHKFILFVSGMSVKSTNAIENLRKICEEFLQDNYEFNIVDISRDKIQAVEYQIVGIPTLIRINPLPPKMILGDLSDREKVIRILGL